MKEDNNTQTLFKQNRNKPNVRYGYRKSNIVTGQQYTKEGKEMLPWAIGIAAVVVTGGVVTAIVRKRKK
jgi:hypothetical protein